MAVKQAAAAANHDLGLLDDERYGAIRTACEEIRAGALVDQFVVDVIQGGAGTSTNMNANEVIANRALELMGHVKGDYHVLHPNEHVNMSQSTNDVYPTPVKDAIILETHAARGDRAVAGVLQSQGRRVPRRAEDGTHPAAGRGAHALEQEFGTYAQMLGEDRARMSEAVLLLHEINLGAAAIGTMLKAPEGYVESACGHLAEITGLPLDSAVDLIEATQDCGSFVQLSGTCHATLWLDGDSYYPVCQLTNKWINWHRVLQRLVFED